MSKRMLWLGLLVFFLLAGLTAGVFTNSIRRALTLPMQMMSTNNVASQMQPSRQATPNVPQQPTMGAVATQQQMPQNILAQDTFQRTDQNLWGTASDGRQWDGDANAQANIFSVTANHGQIIGPGTFNALLGSSATNIETLLDGSLSHFNGNANLGVVLRYTDTNNWYKALIDGKHLTVLKRANGQTTQLASVAFSAQDAQVYMLRFRAVGVMLFARAWAAGTPEPTDWMITTTDMTFQSGLAGVRVVLQQGLTISITSFAATTASSTV